MRKGARKVITTRFGKVFSSKDQSAHLANISRQTMTAQSHQRRGSTRASVHQCHLLQSRQAIGTLAFQENHQPAGPLNPCKGQSPLLAAAPCYASAGRCCAPAGGPSGPSTPSCPGPPVARTGNLIPLLPVHSSATVMACVSSLFLKSVLNCSVLFEECLLKCSRTAF